jgi:hypothetical protein
VVERWSKGHNKSRMMSSLLPKLLPQFIHASKFPPACKMPRGIPDNPLTDVARDLPRCTICNKQQDPRSQLAHQAVCRANKRSCDQMAADIAQKQPPLKRQRLIDIERMPRLRLFVCGSHILLNYLTFKRIYACRSQAILVCGDPIFLSQMSAISMILLLTLELLKSNHLSPVVHHCHWLQPYLSRRSTSLRFHIPMPYSPPQSPASTTQILSLLPTSTPPLWILYGLGPRSVALQTIVLPPTVSGTRSLKSRFKKSSTLFTLSRGRVHVNLQYGPFVIWRFLLKLRGSAQSRFVDT